MITKQHVLDNMNPCGDGAEWLATQPDLVTAWQNCKRGDWMLWLLTEANMLTEKQDLTIQLMALETPIQNGRKVIDPITDERLLAFIELKRQKIAGLEIDNVTWDVAFAAARAAVRDAARDAAWSAAWEWQADKLRNLLGNPFK